MKEKTYLPYEKTERLIWLTNFSTKIIGYRNILGLSETQVNTVIKMTTVYTHIIKLIDNANSFSKHLNAIKSKSNPEQGSTIREAVRVFTPDPSPLLTQSCIFNYIAKVAKVMKASPNYTPTIGIVLGITGEETFFISDEYWSNGTAKAQSGYVAIEFDKRNIEGMHIYSLPLGRTDMSLMERIGTAQDSPFHDNRPLLVPGKPEKRIYQTIAIIHDTKIGAISDPFSAVFTG